MPTTLYPSHWTQEQIKEWDITYAYKNRNNVYFRNKKK